MKYVSRVALLFGIFPMLMIPNARADLAVLLINTKRNCLTIARNAENWLINYESGIHVSCLEDAFLQHRQSNIPTEALDDMNKWFVRACVPQMLARIQKEAHGNDLRIDIERFDAIAELQRFYQPLFKKYCAEQNPSVDFEQFYGEYLEQLRTDVKKSDHFLFDYSTKYYVDRSRTEKRIGQ
jgi:hypothetical protein